MSATSISPYVCRRCISSGYNAVSQPQRARASAPARIAAQWGRKLATVKDTVASPLGSKRRKPSKQPPSNTFLVPESNIRDRLRQWEAEHATPAEHKLLDLSPHETTSNSLFHAQAGALSRILKEPEAPDQWSLLADGDGLADLRHQGRTAHLGDLLEIATRDAREPVLAVFLGRHLGQLHYYTSAGSWFASSVPVRSSFRVPGFAEPSELQPLLDSILQQFSGKFLGEQLDPPREVAGIVLDKMTAFLEEASAVFYAHLIALSGAGPSVAAATNAKALDLAQIADIVLPHRLKKGTKFPPETLYAVHRVLKLDDNAVQLVPVSASQNSYLYEVNGETDARIARKVERMLRELCELGGNWKWARSPKFLEINALGKFIVKARKAVNLNRERRSWTPNGVLGPETSSAEFSTVWSPEEMEYIRFIEMWAAEALFDESSTTNATAAMVLRLVGVYDDVAILRPAVGFTFLQELGWIAPWDIQARYKTRFPGIKPSREGQIHRPLLSLAESSREDVAAGHRRNWGDLKVYCIDNEATLLVDDGVSLEPTDERGQYWVHTHIADPASKIRHDSDIAQAARELPSDMYVPWHATPMLPCADIVGTFSLAPGRACLTFSALVNDEGELLDYKIQPGVVNNVIHTTHEEVLKVIPRKESKIPEPNTRDAVLEVGTAPPRPILGHLRKAGDFSEQELEDLSTLARIGEKWIRGPVRQDFQNLVTNLTPVVEVSFDDVTAAPANRQANSSTVWHGDPFIKVYYSQHTRDYLVEGLMILAGVVAARWCSERSIPVPYRSTTDAHNIKLLQLLLETDIYPQLESGVPLQELSLSNLYSLYGSGVLSAEPRPHPMMGLDAYVKATSPLRRFGDLVLHWQVHAALAEERRRGRSLHGEDCTKGKFLPFSKVEMGRLLVDLQDREAIQKALNNRLGLSQWIRQALVRAWRFGNGIGEKSGVPERIIFRVRKELPASPPEKSSNVRVYGTIDWFGQPAYMDIDSLDGVAETADLADGDRLEAKVEEMDVSSSRIKVRAVRRL